ncbi:hypothetical protein BGX28_009064 [Mortierella sp. GBA30]|nr:hypothetical protein BGX28_009064 [Mortierella sp. GBA30]
MAALRAMLQLRSTSQPSSTLPSQYQQQLQVDTSDTQPTHSNSSNNQINTNTTTNTQSSSLHGLSTGSFHPHHPSSGVTPSPKITTPTKKPAPFQNLGLHSGAASGNLGLVKFALDNGQPIDSVLNGVYAIHAACCSNANVAVVLYLIERGADVNATRLPRKYSNEKGVQTVGTTGSTPLHFAAANGCLTVVDILLRHGAIVDMTDKYGSSPLSVAAARNHPEVASLLRQYSAMQRGVQDLTPDMDTKEPLMERRVSTDSSHRVSTSASSPKRTTPSGHSKETSTQSLPPPAVRSVQTNRAPGQRRISLPSIIESPSPPNIPPPRQSCDFGRIPQSTEPLVRSTASFRSTPSQPTRNITLSPSRPPEDRDRAIKPVREQQQQQQQLSNATIMPPRIKKEQAQQHQQTGGGRSLQRAHTQGGVSSSPSYLTTPETPAVKRRRSMESVGFLSPQSAISLARRKSFDQLSSIRQTDDSKSRRSSDASSTKSQGTATTSGTSSSSSSATVTTDSTVSEQGYNGSGSSAFTSQKSRGVQDEKDMSTRNKATNGSKKVLPSPLTRSSSQPMLEQMQMQMQVKPRRPPLSVAVASENVARQSLDLQRLVSNQERTELRRSVEPRNDSDSDLPGQLLRRRTMQDTPNPRLVPMPRYHSMRSGMETLSSTGNNAEDESANGSGGSGVSSGSLQEIAASRHSTSSLPSGSSLVFSGSATVSGRLSRIWTGKEYAKDGTTAGTWNTAEFGETTSAESVGLGMVKDNRPRPGMLNRLSGMWLRR